MAIKQQLIGLYTLIRRELVRMFRISTQVFLPPVITTLLYFLIFGSIIGNQIGLIRGIPYTLFIAPGLIMMAVITNSYSHVSGSLFSMRFQKSIEEILVSPLHPAFLLLGFVLSGVLRGLIVAFLVFIVSSFFVEIHFNVLPMTLLIVLLVASLFSLAGFINGLIARNFDDIALVPTFILSPLIYLGGVFYSTDMLPGIWQKVTYFNPIFYMINVLRHVMIGQQEVNMMLAMSVICIIILVVWFVCFRLMKKGVGIRA